MAYLPAVPRLLAQESTAYPDQQQDQQQDQPQDQQPDQDAGQPDQTAGQPAARAIRLGYVEGDVTLSQNGQVITDQAVVNTPLLEGMTLATDDDGRAAIQFEDGSVARIAPDSSLTLAVLRGAGSNAQAELDVDRGLAYFELQDTGQAGQISVRFGDSVVTASGFTILRVDDDTPPGALAVFSGTAHLTRDSGLAVEVRGGESVTLSADDPDGYNLAETIPQNSWDQWNSDRDQALNAQSEQQSGPPAGVAPQNGDESNNPAWNDLDANGTWYNVPGQGYVWSPYQAANPDFDPYGDGNWVGTLTFGYVWVSAYPWGFLPYEFGDWNFYPGFGWGWAPGRHCHPWWTTGHYGGANIGFAPGWYHRVPRPISPHGPFPRHPMPMIAVNRKPMVWNVGLPDRGRNAPVTINGRTAMAVRTLPARSAYEHATVFGFRDGHASAILGSPARPLPTERYGFTITRPPDEFSFTRRGIAPRRNYIPRNGSAPRSNFAPQFHFSQPSRSFPPARSFAPPARNFGGGSRYSGGGFRGSGNRGGGGGSGGGHDGGRR